ncbi:hypothetical protein CK203_010537 [Vitis vinifera]|uniref:Uncharacterized protein n=1 Tax=Vitis vinifera TaxID=29760 RepID=A0A438JT52_VITVI|nr:hypothetical protein CK203_010537 [Vitis vinifera]
MGERVVENGSAYSQTEDYSARSPGSSPLARVAMERSPAGSPAARTAMERSPVGSPAARAAFERSPAGSPAARTAFERSPAGSPAARPAFDSPSREFLDSHFFKPFSEDASPHAKDTQRCYVVYVARVEQPHPNYLGGATWSHFCILCSFGLSLLLNYRTKLSCQPLLLILSCYCLCSDYGGADSFLSGDKSFDEPTWGKFDTNDDMESIWGMNSIGATSKVSNTLI